jgi:plastocyanin
VIVAAFAILVVSTLPALPALPAPPAPLSQGLRDTGTIRGRVEVRRPSTPPERRPNVADLGAHVAQSDVSDRLTSVVYFDSAPRAAAAAVPGHAVLDQRDERFAPHVLAVTTGTVVDFPNSDHIYHNVFSLSKTRPFDLGRYATGRSKAIKFDRPGIVRVFCDIHSHRNAFILVFNHSFFALTDAEGATASTTCRPARTTSVAWNERRVLGSATRRRARWRREGGTGLRAAMTLCQLSARADLPRERCWRCFRSAPRSTSSTSRSRARGRAIAAAHGIRATVVLVDQLRKTRIDTYTVMARLIADLPAQGRGPDERSADRRATISGTTRSP